MAISANSMNMTITKIKTWNFRTKRVAYSFERGLKSDWNVSKSFIFYIGGTNRERKTENEIERNCEKWKYLYVPLLQHTLYLHFVLQSSIYIYTSTRKSQERKNKKKVVTRNYRTAPPLKLNLRVFWFFPKWIDFDIWRHFLVF